MCCQVAENIKCFLGEAYWLSKEANHQGLLSFHEAVLKSLSRGGEILDNSQTEKQRPDWAVSQQS